MKSGDKVKCIDTSGGIVGCLTLNRIYTVKHVIGIDVWLDYVFKVWRFKCT